MNSSPIPSSNLTTTQQRIWAGQRLYPNAPLYNMALAISVDGPVDPGLLEKALQTVVQRSDALRSVFEETDGIPHRRVKSRIDVSLDYADFSHEPAPETAAFESLSARSASMFDLSNGLFDTSLLKLNDKRFIWYLNQHHLATDGWSKAVLISQVSEAYEQLRKGESVDVEPLPSFEAYAAYESSRQATAAWKKAAEYWKQRSEIVLEPLEFYGALPSSPTPSSERLRLDLGPERSARLRRLAEDPAVRSLTLDQSLFNLFSTVLFALLRRLTDRERLIIGTPAHNRPTPDFKRTIGVFIELFPLLVDIDGGETFRSLLSKVKHESTNFLLNARPGASFARSAATFNVVLNYINVSLPDFAGLRTETDWLHPGCGDPGHHLRLEIHDFGATGEFTLLFDLNADVFTPATRQWVLDHFQETLDAFLDDQNQSIDHLELTTNQVSTSTPVPSSGLDGFGSIVEAFQSQVEAAPGRTAVVSAGRQLSFGELDVRSSSLAKALIAECGVRPYELIPVLAERTPEFVIAVLAILKAGAAYVPIDPSYPDERIKLLLDDTGARIVVVHPATMADRLAESEVVAFSASSAQGAGTGERWSATVAGSDLAYTLYTSGSTGRPNGVLVEHRHVLSLVESLHRAIYANHEGPLEIALVAPVAFDASVQQIFASLLQGHCLHIVPEDARRDGTQLLRFYDRHGIDVSDGTPAHLQLMLESRYQCRSFPQRLIIGGERLSGALVREFYRRFGRYSPIVTNIYGVAECCVDSSAFHITPAIADELPSSVPIGKPLANSEILILNSAGRRQPAGVAGEIAILGDGVSRGYLNRPALTAERFVESSGTKMYRTGDIGRYDAGGNLHFVGRRDNQVKIRGHRVELGEVEHRIRAFQSSQALALPTISNTVAAPRCSRCLLNVRHPGVSIEADGICSVCREFADYRETCLAYFDSQEALTKLVTDVKKRSRSSEYDCLLLYSGGKDSSYVLYQLVKLGFKVLAFTFDNGFISQAAFENIRRQTARLGVESVTQQAVGMNEIFSESLLQDQTVCSGCFRALTTISTRLAHERGINVVITGLSRGQILDTKLGGLLRQGVRDVAEIERRLKEFRVLFHSNKDRTAELLNDDLADVAFGDMEFVDYFRYDDVSVSGIRRLLESQDEFWRQPRDTGFCSSNCRMNDVGTCVHSAERGYHNYEAPLSWDIRLGVSSRDDVLPEVTHEIDVRPVRKILKQIGYGDDRITDVRLLVHHGGDGNAHLHAYFVATGKIAVKALRDYISESLPRYMVPARFVQVSEMPLTSNGKIDDRALLRLMPQRQSEGVSEAPPEGDVERRLADIWREVLDVERVGRHDDFFDLGGDSLLAMQIVARVNQAFAIDLALADTFDANSISKVARVVSDKLLDEIDGLSEEEAQRLIDAAE